MRRRTFLSWFGMGWIASRLPVLLTTLISACSNGGQTQAPSASNSANESAAGGFKAVGMLNDLNQKGQILVERFSPAPLLVVRDPSDSKKLIAVNPTCTHQGCTVNWKADQKTFACPCHGSAFSANGQVIQGPAAKPLKTYAVKLEGQQIVVKA